jgi:arabinofuranan 3-O-arabinosyltransferase
LTDATGGATGPSRRPPFALLALAVAIYLPLLLTAPGRIGADTKSYLYLDPARLLSRAWSMWDPNVGLGTVSHQTIGYLWPMGPWFWAFERLGVPDWVAQRLWLGTILLAAGAGARWLLQRVLGWGGGAAAVAGFAYACTPYVLTLAARLSAILLPYAGLPWLVGLTVLAVHRGGWRWPATFALVVATVGSVNATALLLVGLAPAWWLVHAVARRAVPARAAAAAAVRIGALTLLANLWWLGGLWAQGGWGIDILRYTETAEVVASASNGAEVLRGLGYWFFYGGDRLGPWIEAGSSYTQRLPLLVLTFALPLLAIAAAALVRFRDRAFFVGLVAIGTLAAVGAHPWDDPPLFGRGVKTFLLSDVGLAMRSLPRAAPLVALGMAACLGAGAEALGARLSGGRTDVDRRRALAVVVAAAALSYLALPPLWTGQMVASNLDRPSELPSYWEEVAAHLSAADDGTRVLEVPGADFASYRWGNTVDPVTPGLTDRPYAARELIPYGTPAAADLLSALDRRIQEATLDPGTLAVVARLLGVGEVVLRDDLQFERYRTPRPYQLAPFLAAEAGLGDPVGFGEPVVNEPDPSVPLVDEQALALDDRAPRPPVEVFPVEDARPIVDVRGADGQVVLAGDGEGLVDAAAAGLLGGEELVRYASSLGAAGVSSAVSDGAALVVTDGNRRQGRRWSTVRDVLGYVEPPPMLEDDLTDNRLPVFPEAEAGWETLAASGVLEVTATSYGNPISFTPEYRPAHAADGDLTTEWRTGASADVRGERIELRAPAGVAAGSLRIVQQLSGFRNRHITRIAVSVDGGDALEVELDDRSLSPQGQLVDLPVDAGDTVHRVALEVLADSAGRHPRWGRPVRFNGLSQVGFTELELLPPGGAAGGDLGSSTGARSGEDRAVATDAALALPAAATASITGGGSPVALVLTRWRAEPTDAVRSDPERALVRTWDQPVARTFELAGTARLSPRAADEVLAEAVGVSGPQVQATSRLTGVATALATAALDGDRSTWWSPAFDDGRPGGDAEPALTVTAAAPVTLDAIAPVVVDDGRRSVPTSIRVEVDGAVAGSVPVLGDGAAAPLPAPVTGTTFRFVIDGADERTTTEWYSNAQVPVPVAIAELGVPELAASVPDRFDTGCRPDLLQVDGVPIPIRLTGSVDDALAGRPVPIEGCAGAATGSSIELDAGPHRLEAVAGADTGFDVDRVVLRSGFGGEALVPRSGGDTPTVEVREGGRARVEVAVAGATPGEPFWLVLGQSQSTGWELDGHRSELVDGFANGWRITPDADSFVLTMAWTPQRVVTAGLLASAAAVVACLAIVLVPAFRRRPGDDGAVDPRPSGSFLADGAATTRWGGGVLGAVTLGAAVAIGPVSAAVVAAVVSGMAFGSPLVRRVARLGPVVAYGLAAGYIVARQVISKPTSAFEWPAEQAVAHQPALVAVALLVAAVALDARRPTGSATDATPAP